MAVGQVRSRRRHERILEAALRVFTQKGYHEAAVDDIAADAETSKGGIYFHFPTKQAIFLALLDRTAALLRSKVEEAIRREPEPLARADLALSVVLETFGSHRTLSRLFFVEAFGAGREFQERLAELRASFSGLIEEHLEEALRQGAIPPLDTRLASQVWFGALNEVVTRWVLDEQPRPLEEAYPGLRRMLRQSIGVAAGPEMMKTTVGKEEIQG
jgi:AcrR family transcriptional regulator